MGAPKGNKYWEFRNKHGKDHKYTPEALWEEALKYFQWVEDNPLWEAVIIQRGIKVKDEEGNEKTEYFVKAPKMRAMTIAAFCLFADICEKTFLSYRNNKDYIQVTTRIEKNIYSQKFEGAAATLLQPNIIARDLGLREGIDHNINDARKSIEDLFPTEDELNEKDKPES
jgi:hypothetical protein